MRNPVEDFLQSLRHERGQPSFDKQFVRDYLETLTWDKTPPGPILPDDVVVLNQREVFGSV